MLVHGERRYDCPVETEKLVRDALYTLLREIVEGPTGEAYVLNPGDGGLLVSLERLSAAEASAHEPGRSPIASHIDHLRYGLQLTNRWLQGEDLFGTADFSASWARQAINEEEWYALRNALERELRALESVLAEPRAWQPASLTTALGVIVHLAYHLGAIRQISPAAVGPRATN
jgi:hypothetical protein